MSKESVKVRPATVDDMPSLLNMSRAFYEEADAAKFADFTDKDITSLLERLVGSDDAEVLMADGGMIILMMVPIYWNPGTWGAQELAWWVVPERRDNGVGRALIIAAEDWARERKAEHLTMVTLKGNANVAQQYLKHGFRLTESSYSKRL